MARLSVEDRVTLLSALPGYGKTAAVRQWIDSVDLPVAWLSLDLLDEEPTAFWSNTLAALGLAIPGIDDEPAMLLWERGVEDPFFLGALAAGLSALASPLVLVLDSLPADLDRGVLEGLAMLVERTGDNLRLVMTTRSDPALPFPRWQELGWLNEIREDVLRLSDEEALEIADRTETAILDPGQIVALNEQVGRWPIGFHMALLSRPPGGSGQQSPSPSPGSNRLLASYLVAEVLEALTEDERNVALALCVLERFDPDMCTQLVGPHAGDAVRQLLRRGLFLTVVDPRTGLMRFHDLFRELMETELAYRDPEARLDLHRRAAMLWRERGDLMSAYHHVAVIGESDSARKLLVDPTVELLDRGDLEDLHRFAQQLPNKQQVTNANLAADLALVALYTDGTLAARRWCDRADALADQGDDALRRRLLELRCTTALFDADLDSALSIIETRGLTPAGGGDPFEQRFPIVASRVMMASRRQEEADEWISAAERIVGPAIVTEVTVPTLRAWHEWMFGSLARSVTLIDRALAWVEDHRIRRHPLAFDTLISAAWIRLSIGDIPNAVRIAERAMLDAEAIGYAWNQLQAGYLGANLAVITGEPARALAIIDGLDDAVPFDSCRPYSDRIRGVRIEALALDGLGEEAAEGIGVLAPGPRTQLLRARFVASTDREIEHLLQGFEDWPAFERLEAQLLLGARRNGSSPSTKLLELITECAEQGWAWPFLAMGPRVERFLRQVPLQEVHPRLASALDYLTPVALAQANNSNIRLTSRELSLVEFLPTHLSNAQIGEQLYLSVNTVKSNLKTLYRKLDASTRAEAVEAAKKLGLI